MGEQPIRRCVVPTVSGRICVGVSRQIHTVESAVPLNDGLVMREDRATPADERAVAKHLAARDLGIAKPDTIEYICEGYLDDARCLLAAVFPDSKAGD
jgi:hypothetical protein